MTKPETDGAMAAWAEEALGSVVDLERWLRELRAEATREVLSMASRRRIEAVLTEAEENLLEFRAALLVLAYGRAADPGACIEVVTERAREILASWRVAVETAQARSTEREAGFLERFGPLLAVELRKVVENLRRGPLHDPAAEKRLDEERRLLARPDLPVM